MQPAVGADRQPGAVEVILAPWRHAFAPSRAARLLADAAPRQFRLAVLIGLIIGTALVGGALFVGQPDTSDLPMPGLTLRRARTGGVVLDFTPGELDDLLSDSPNELLPPVVRLTLSAVLTLGCAITALAALMVPVAGGGRRWLRAFVRSARAVVSGGGVLILALLVIIAGWLAVRAAERLVRDSYGVSNAPTRVMADPGDEVNSALQVIAAAGVLLLAALLLAWLTRAARAVRPQRAAGQAHGVRATVNDAPADRAMDDDVHAARGPRCEGCGYDLSHPPSDGRCPECGLDANESLVPGRRRPSRWEQSRTWSAWAADSLAVVLRPRRFYSKLAVHGHDAAYAGFAARHYMLIGLGAAVWSYAMLNHVIAWGMGGPPPMLRLVMPLLIGTFVPLAAWFFHRLIGAAYDAGSRWDADPPDPVLADRVIAFEAAYLWVLCTWCGVMLTSFALFGNWMTALANALMPPVIGRVVIDGMVLMIGNATILAAWGWRYFVIMRAVRWSNF